MQPLCVCVCVCVFVLSAAIWLAAWLLQSLTALERRMKTQLFFSVPTFTFHRTESQSGHNPSVFSRRFKLHQTQTPSDTHALCVITPSRQLFLTVNFGLCPSLGVLVIGCQICSALSPLDESGWRCSAAAGLQTLCWCKAVCPYVCVCLCGDLFRWTHWPAQRVKRKSDLKTDIHPTSFSKPNAQFDGAAKDKHNEV